jgi:HPt (histidine-containing phosphotransfer) domain-containing protein
MAIDDTRQPDDAGVLDPAMVAELQALARAAGTGLLARLHASFARDAPQRLAALRAAAAAGDADALAFNAHSLKGSAANLGATRVVELCSAIEAVPAEAPQLLGDLEDRIADAEGALARLAA